MQEDGGEGGGRRGGDGSVGGEDREMRNGGGDGDDDDDDGTRWNDMLKLVTSSRWRCLEGNVQAEEELKTLTILVESVRNETIRTSSIWKGPQIYENIISLLESTLSLACEAYQVCAPGNAAQYNIRGADEDFADRIRSIILHRYQLLGVLRFQEFQSDYVRIGDSTSFAKMLVWRHLHTDSLSEAGVLKLTIHYFYYNMVNFRPSLRRAIGNEIQKVVRKPNYCLGMEGLLHIIASIVRGFAIPLSSSHMALLREVLLPLHANNKMLNDVDCIMSSYYVQLIECLKAFIEKKELDILFRDVKIGSDPHGKKALIIAFPIIIKCLSSENSRIIETALSVVSNGVAIETLLVADYDIRKRFLPLLLNALLSGGKLHWSRTVNNCRYDVLCKFQKRFSSEFNAYCEAALGGSTHEQMRIGENTSTIHFKKNSRGVEDDESVHRAIEKDLSKLDFIRCQKFPNYDIDVSRSASDTSQPAPTPRVSNPRPPVPQYTTNRGLRQVITASNSGESHKSAQLHSFREPTTPSLSCLPNEHVKSTNKTSSWQPTKAPFASSFNRRLIVGAKQKPSRFEDGSKPSCSIPLAAFDEANENIADAEITGASEQYPNGFGRLTNDVMRRLAECDRQGENESPSIAIGLHSWNFRKLPDLILQDLVFGDEIGKGSFSVVRYAKLINAKVSANVWPEYAVKQISSNTIKKYKYTKSIQREIAILSSLEHPNIARLVSTFRWKDCYYLVLEFAAQGDMYQQISSLGSLDVHSTRFWMGEVLAALVYLHRLGYMFSDLKPENIMLTCDGHVKLGDFGGARPVTTEAENRVELTSTNILKHMRDGDWRMRHLNMNGNEMDIDGTSAAETYVDPGSEGDEHETLQSVDERYESTPAYMSPEMIQGVSPTISSDLWAFGCVLFCCLAGRPPIWADSLDELMGAAVSFEIDDEQFPEGFDGDARTLVTSLLKDINNRASFDDIITHKFFSPLVSLVRRHNGINADVYNFDLLIGLEAPKVSKGNVIQTSNSKSSIWSQRQNSILWAASQQSSHHLDNKANNRIAGKVLETVVETDVEVFTTFV